MYADYPTVIPHLYALDMHVPIELRKYNKQKKDKL